jgi:predicted secreted protein
MRGTPASLGLLGLFLALSAACGAASGPAAPRVVELGLDQAGQSVQVRVGDHVRVKLQDQFPVPGSSLVWQVSTSPTGVLALEAESGPSPQQALRAGDYTAEFVARSQGHAVLTAHGATSCEAMAKQACPDREFTITVTVA